MPVAQDRWAAIKQFVAQWHRPLAPEDGLLLEDIREAQSWSEVPFPQALQEWYLLGGSRRDLNAAQNRLLSPAELEVRAEHVVFFVENQNVVRWGIRVSDLGMADPPVYLDNDFTVPTAPPAHPWLLENATLSEFLLQMIMVHTLVGMPAQEHVFRGWAEIDASTLEQIATLFPRFNLPLWHWPRYPTQFFGMDEVLLLVDGALWLWVAAQSLSAWKHLEERIPGTEIETSFPRSWLEDYS